MILSIITYFILENFGKMNIKKDFKTSSWTFVIIGCFRTFDWKHSSA